VFAAASLSGAFPAIGNAFESSHPGLRVRFNFDGSQRLRTQLEFGAKAHVFASADETQMGIAQEANVLASSPVPFANNSLVVIVPVSNPDRGVPVRGLQDLARDGVKLAIAQEEVPAGRYARVVIDQLAALRPTLGHDYAERVLGNVVSEEANVRGVVQKVVLNEVDAGIVYSTDVSGEEVDSSVGVIPIPPDANVMAVYPVATLKGAKDPETAAAFVEFLLSDQAQLILRKHGFKSPQALPKVVRTGQEG
jgi:molybdate transport system substrate-binding protein